MTKMQKFLSSLFIIGSILTSQVMAAEKPQMPKTEQVEKAPMNMENKVNINTATATEIKNTLVGIGMKKAEAIVEYREKHGSFTSIEQLTEVSGIGQATLEKNRERILL
ncbi:ComEA family DNA-binding protein [Pasteurella bettyae]|uniref:Competence protein ComEA helix-hairpin-helix repeat region n=1 Tax=Pasteurella bettyae CCUG 2042 TaxID=1095749 RepID=I3DFH9_9PAST|nr:helix-hairpin-helix domain-containing protein [Pasteurella bettyae]EIJ70472.1 competence protein ComEA helix-hairpin-helix repeat region [Pasteurella bettyae CCUG 2042]SUB21047.1 putative competence protein ComEA [Pasteurella bettyae]